MSKQISAADLIESKPWYRHAMVWMIILLPLSVVVASFFTVVIAHKHAPMIIESEISAPAGR